MTITITEARNAASLRSDNLYMDVEINHPDYGWIPYTLDPADTDTTINNNQVMALIGTNFTTYVAPTQAELYAVLAEEVRSKRDQLLSELDVVISNPLRWAELTTTEQTEVATYRTALLDVPQQTGFPQAVVWPQEPTT